MTTGRLKSLLEPYDYIDFALLFGSYVSGGYNALSDIDIAIYTKRPIDLFERGMLISMLEDALGKEVDLVLLNGLERDDPKLAFNIINNHKVIFSRAKEKYIDFKADTYKYYFDLQPMYEMFDRALKERIANGTYGKTQAS